jgi:hypothetical protein
VSGVDKNKENVKVKVLECEKIYKVKEKEIEKI